MGGFTCSRNSLIVLNLFYITVGITLIALGAHWMTSNQVSSLPIIGGVIACGVFLLVVSVGGIYATLKHHQVLLFFYMVVLFVLFIIQFSIACACLAVSKDTSDSLAKQGWSSVNYESKEHVQNYYSCCGFKDFLDRLNASDPLGHPSCSAIEACQDPECKHSNITTEECCTGHQTKCRCNTCDEALESVIGQAFRVTGGVSLFFSFTEFIGIWLTVRYRNTKNPYFNGNPSAFL